MTLRLVDRVVVKGRSVGIAIYELLSDHRPLEETASFLEAWADAMKLYELKRWAEAATAFTALKQRRPNDGPSKLLRDRCLVFASDPPPVDWDGYTVMLEK